jgi:hypothetical protein
MLGIARIDSATRFPTPIPTQEDISVATGLVTVDTDVDFEGFGLMMGLDGFISQGSHADLRKPVVSVLITACVFTPS